MREAAEALRDKGVRSVAISGTFSPVNSDHEVLAGDIVREVFPEAFVTLSHEIGSIEAFWSGKTPPSSMRPSSTWPAGR